MCASVVINRHVSVITEKCVVQEGRCLMSGALAGHRSSECVSCVIVLAVSV